MAKKLSHKAKYILDKAYVLGMIRPQNETEEQYQIQQKAKKKMKKIEKRKQKKVEKAKREGEKLIEKNVRRYMKHMGYL